MGFFLKRWDRVLWPVLALLGGVVFRPLALLSGGIGALGVLGSTPRPLIIRPGGMGDLVLLTLALREQGIAWGDVEFLIERRSEDWAKHLGLSYVCYDRPTIRAILWFLSRLGRCAEIYVTEQRFGLSALPAWYLMRPSVLGGARVRGFRTVRSRVLLNEALPYDPTIEHMRDSFRRLIAPLGPRSTPREPNPPHVSRRGVVVAIAGRGHPSRELGIAEWLTLLESALDRDEPLWVRCAPNDRPFAEALTNALVKQGWVATRDDSNFEQFVSEIKNATCVVGPEGGPTHIASFYGTKVHAFFSSGPPEKWAPLAPESQLYYDATLSCRPCARFGQTPRCQQSHVCLAPQAIQPAATSSFSVLTHSACPTCLAKGEQIRWSQTLREHDRGQVFDLLECLECQTQWVRNPPSDLAPFYETPSGVSMAKRGSSVFSRLRSILIHVEAKRALKGLSNSVTVLDYGSGDGSFAKAVFERGYSVIAVDRGPRPETLPAEIRYYRTAEFEHDATLRADVAVIRHVLEHVADPAQTLSLLKSRGVFRYWIVVPSLDSRLRRILGQHWFYWDPPRHLVHWSEAGFRRLIARFGARVVRRQYFAIDEIVCSLYRAAAMNGTQAEWLSPKSPLSALSSAFLSPWGRLLKTAMGFLVELPAHSGAPAPHRDQA